MPNHKNYNYEFHELNNSPNDVLLILRNPRPRNNIHLMAVVFTDQMEYKIKLAPNLS